MSLLTRYNFDWMLGIAYSPSIDHIGEYTKYLRYANRKLSDRLLSGNYFWFSLRLNVDLPR